MTPVMAAAKLRHVASAPARAPRAIERRVFAFEVEGISENQRIVTQLLSKQEPARALHRSPGDSARP